MRACWCNNTDYLPFGPEYGECRACGTLVYLKDMPSDQFIVHDDDSDYYGKKYWLQHQQEAFGYTDIHYRARNDLTERNLHWLKTLLKYRPPMASVLELGCAHGSFVALMQQLGYQASGLEMSPWVVSFAQKTFGITVHTGPIENLKILSASLDVIVLMDVLEHLPEPVATMERCLEFLKPNGLLLIQTPKFSEGVSFNALQETKGAFLDQLKSDEHLYLFSESSITKFFRELGAEYVCFEPAIFARYDMFLVVSRVPIQVYTQENIESVLLSNPNSRFVLALLDLRERELELTRKLEESEIDRAARGVQIETLTAMLQESDIDRKARGAQITTLTAMLQESDIDRKARGAQIEILTGMLQKPESDLGVQIKKLMVMLQQSELDRDVRAKQIETLTARLQQSESLREAKDAQIETLTTTLLESEYDLTLRAEEIETLLTDLRILFSRPGFAWLNKFAKWPEVKKLVKKLEIPNE